MSEEGYLALEGAVEGGDDDRLAQVGHEFAKRDQVGELECNQERSYTHAGGKVIEGVDVQTGPRQCRCSRRERPLSSHPPASCRTPQKASDCCSDALGLGSTFWGARESGEEYAPVMGGHVLCAITRVGSVLDDEAALPGDGVPSDTSDQLRALAAEHGPEDDFYPSRVPLLALHFNSVPKTVRRDSCSGM